VLRTVQRAREACERVLAATRQLKQSLLHHLFTYGPVPVPQAAHVPLKETEIGPMPEHWGARPIGGFANFVQYGLSVRGGASGRYPILRMNNLQEGRLVVGNVQGGMQYVNLDPETFAKFRLARNDLLFNRTNSFDLVGKTALFDVQGEFVFASYLVRLQLDAERLDPSFANYYLNKSSTQARLKRLATRGVSQSNINATKLKGFEIPVPPISEQREIARQLGAVDAKIAALEKRRAALDALFRSLLEHLMTGRLRLPEFANAKPPGRQAAGKAGA
jgi:type I restriction enzyme S subunit